MFFGNVTQWERMCGFAMLTMITTSFLELEQENTRLVTWSADGGWEDWEQGVLVSSSPRRRRQSCRGRVLASWPRWRPSWPRCTAPCSRPASAPAARSGPWTCGGCCSPPSLRRWRLWSRWRCLPSHIFTLTTSLRSSSHNKCWDCCFYHFVCICR